MALGIQGRLSGLRRTPPEGLQQAGVQVGRGPGGARSVPEFAGQLTGCSPVARPGAACQEAGISRWGTVGGRRKAVYDAVEAQYPSRKGALEATLSGYGVWEVPTA